MDISYCNDKCPIGKAMRDKFLNENNSAYDAALDFRFFIDKCFQDCSHRAEHDKLVKESISEII